jgi:putative ABC transport system permease protein
MKFRRLLLANLGRRKTRTLLSVGSFAVALFLFGLLTAIRGAFDQGVQMAGTDRLVVINRVAIIQPLPLAYHDRLLRVRGVADVSFALLVRGHLSGPEELLPAVRRGPRVLRTHVPRVRHRS